MKKTPIFVIFISVSKGRYWHKYPDEYGKQTYRQITRKHGTEVMLERKKTGHGYKIAVEQEGAR